MDDDVREAIEDLRAEMREAARQRGSSGERRAERRVEEAREDLEDVLRREGYPVTRKQLDAWLEEDEQRRFETRMDAYLAARAKTDDGTDDGGDDNTGDGDDNKGKKKPAGAKKETPEGEPKPEDEEWV